MGEKQVRLEVIVVRFSCLAPQPAHALGWGTLNNLYGKQVKRTFSHSLNYVDFQ